MNTYVDYPVHMKQEARKLIEATIANPGKETAMAIYNFIDRSREHEACFNCEVEQLPFRPKQEATHSTAPTFTPEENSPWWDERRLH